MARNRKRAKERRARRPSPVGTSPLGATGAERDDQAPDPIRHAAPDAELAEAQMALGRPDLAGDGEDQPEEDYEASDEDAGVAGGSGGSGRGNGAAFGGEGPPPSGGGELAAPGPSSAPTPAERAGVLARLINFLQGSWRELQRVQWPDRRQVVQATGVVIGFVIVAGIFLGVADTVASHLMNYILTGKW